MKTPEETFEFLAGGHMGALLRSHDWSATPLGQPAQWPQSLRSALSICLGSGFQVAIYWGQELALLYNDAWSVIPGQKHPWAIGRPAREVWPEIWDTIGPMFAKVLEHGEATVSRDQLLAMHRHGFVEECYFDYTFSPIRDEAGGVGGIFNIAVETTFRVLSERRTRLLRDLNEMTVSARSASEASELALAALDTDPADIPFCLLHLLDPEDASHPTLHDWPVKQAMATRSTVMVEKLNGAFPSRLWPELCERAVVIPLPHVGDIAPGVLIVGISPRLVFDIEYQAFLERAAAVIGTAITNARAYEQERRRAEMLAELDRAKTVFFSNVSHEFRTPLTLMLGPIDDMLSQPEGSVGEQNRGLLEVVRRGALRLQRLVNTLLDFSRIEAGRAQASFEPVDLATVTAEMASSFRSAMERAGLDFTVDCQPLSKPAFVDREMWEKVVLNLLSNAFKYTLEGSVRVELSENGGEARLTVSDTGSGIPQHELPKLFERFHRVEGARGRTHEGSGIGLALVHELVKLHGGNVSVSSEAGKGSKFAVSLPFGSAHLPQDHVVATNKPQASSAAAYLEEAMRWLPDAPHPDDLLSPIARPAFRSRVLLADDNRDMREYVQRLLANHYDVAVFSNGADVLTSALASPPDLILTDVMMPQLDGFGLLARLRAEEATKTLPVILLSARSGEEARIEGLAAGADDYIVKPFAARELLARVDAHLSLARMRREADQARRQTEERLTFALEAGGGVGTFDWDVSGDLFYCDARFAQLFSVDPKAAAVGAPLSSFVSAIHLEDRPSILEKVTDACRTGEDYGAEYRVVQPDGSVRWVFARGRCHFDAAGKPTRFPGVVVDITRQVLARQELERVNKELEEFAYVASHDLQEPLRMVSIYTDLLLRRYVPPNQPQAAEFASFIREGAERMSALIRGLLDYSRTIREDKPQAAQSVADLNMALKDAQAALRTRIGESGAIIESSPLPRIRGDEKQLSHVFQNLLGNAIKYQHKGETPRIEISTQQLQDRWVIRVQDNGIGFEPRYAEKIFGLFKRLHKDEYPGTGLGLAICQRIIERYGGRMWAEGVLGEGASFYFSLPAVEPEPES